MNRLNELFIRKKERILNIYFTAGYPELNDTVPIISALAAAGVDLVEIGMPYSDPLADGPTIQASSQVALKNGMSLEILFQQITEARKAVDIPLILMGYFNQVMQYGEERFVRQAKASGIDALILPDLPVEEYELHYKDLFEKHDMQIVFLITPQTPESRIRHIDKVSNSFIYMVSSNAITGAKSGIDDMQTAYFQRIAELKLHNPCLIGFGISNKTSFDKACEFAQGAIIGSAYINALSQGTEISKLSHQFVEGVLHG